MPYVDIDLALIDVIKKYSMQFISIAIAVFFSFRVLYAEDGKDRPAGLIVIAMFILTTSLYDLLNFLDYDYSRQIFTQLDESIFRIRFVGSVILRAVFIVAAFGLMSLKEWARKIVVILSVLTIIMIYWKHPFYVFENIAYRIEQNQLDPNSTELKYPIFPKISMALYILTDICIYGVYLYYLTRPKISTLFRKT